ncbi:MAG: serine acetyltransferase, partial [Bacteroidota bacterium]
MDQHFINRLFQEHKHCPECPSPEQVSVFFDELLGLLFSDRSNQSFDSPSEMERAFLQLQKQLVAFLGMHPNQDSQSNREIAATFFAKLPYIHELLSEDRDALFHNDPAALSQREVVKSYPGFYAMAAYRMAHELYKLEVKIIPRMITEHAHSKTGIDIHPGAQIGRSCFIDHGTGV